MKYPVPGMEIRSTNAMKKKRNILKGKPLFLSTIKTFKT